MIVAIVLLIVFGLLFAAMAIAPAAIAGVEPQPKLIVRPQAPIGIDVSRTTGAVEHEPQAA
ncbi:MAG TPA: hypothetical protein VFQ54_06665 [Thermomicrobiales bacterium]|nr:hypothetical protein [Thermomicrobiales bacterium]